METNNFLNIRSKLTASVILEFETNTRKILFDAILLSTSRDYYCFDVYVDGCLRHHFASGECKYGDKKRISFELPDGTKQIQIYFPCLFETGISNFEIDDGATMIPLKRNQKWLFLGDSITHGYASKFTSYTYVNILSRQFNVNILNQAIAGDMFNAMNIDEELPFQPEAVFVAYGTNDWWHGRNVQITATEYFDKLTKVYPQVKTYALLPIYRLDAAEKHPEVKIPFMKFRDDLRDIMSKYRQITVIDTIDFIPPFAEFYEDGYLHPNDIGFMRYAENLKNYLMF